MKPRTLRNCRGCSHPFYWHFRLSRWALGDQLSRDDQLVWISIPIAWAVSVLVLIFANRKLRRTLTRVLSEDPSRVLLPGDVDES